jgi:hypothetical protein
MVRPKHGGLILGIGFIFALFFFFVVQGQDEWLDSLVTTGPDILLDEWRAVFRRWAQVGVAAAGLAALAWFVLGQWGFSLNHWPNADKRNAWLGLLFLALLAAVPGIVLTPAAQEWGNLAKVFYVANNVSVYYLATLLCSPPSYKYIPYGAAVARRW